MEKNANNESMQDSPDNSNNDIIELTLPSGVVGIADSKQTYKKNDIIKVETKRNNTLIMSVSLSGEKSEAIMEPFDYTVITLSDNKTQQVRETEETVLNLLK